MNNEAPVADRFWLLLDAACVGALDESQAQELGALLDADSALRSLFIDHMQLRRDIQATCRAERVFDRTVARIDATLPQASLPGSLAPSPSFFSTIHTTLGYFSEGIPLAYLLATAIFGIGLLIGSRIYVSDPEQIATNLSPITKDKTLHDPQMPFVGRITGIAHCQWGDGFVAAINGASVPLGRKYALTSGLMEITYNTGAKVILQGPVTFEVESRNGGFLPVGRLTGKVEVEKAKGFSIRTPTATVTDLGTEFGVDVDEAGTTQTRVFRGSVRLQTAAIDKANSDEQVLYENESARVEKSDAADAHRRAIVSVPPNETLEFVRDIPRSTPRQPDSFDSIAFWRFDGDNFLADSSGHGHTLVNHGAKQIDGTASFDGAAIMNTVDSIDLTPFSKIRVSWTSKTPAGSASSVIWEHSSSYLSTHGAIIGYIEDGEGFAGLRNHLEGKDNPFRVETFPVTPDSWETFVVEFDLTSATRSRIIKVLIDGKLVGRGTAVNDIAAESFANAPFFIGARDNVVFPFTGQIDNLKIEGVARAAER